MNPCVYGVWDGSVIDARRNPARRNPARRQAPTLEGFDKLAPGTALTAFIADRGFLVMDEDISLARAFADYLTRAANESCGRCTPCRVGTQRLRDLLVAVADGTAPPGALDEIGALTGQLDTAMCGMGQNCARALRGALAHFPEEFGVMKPGRAEVQHSFIYTTAPCIEACPSKVDVPRYIDGVKNGKFDFALGVVLDKYPLAATCGRVCDRFCESACRRAAVDGPVGIRMLKRYAADKSRGTLQLTPDGARLEPRVPHDHRVAIIGAGPAGITCAYKLLLGGIEADVFDPLQAAGGMACVGIPSYRLPKDVLKAESEDLIRRLGGQFHYGQALGRDFSVSDLFAQGYGAVFLAYGAHKAARLGIPGEDPPPEGYIPGIEFLSRVYRRVERGERFDLAGEVVVIGGGNVAMDCARSARRMGARTVHLVYRRTIADMPADRLEVRAAEEEGIVFHCLASPVAVVAENGRVSGIRVVSMRQTELDANGRRGVEPILGSEAFMPCDWVVAAIGQEVDGNALRPEDGIELNHRGCLKADPDTLETTRSGVFAGGDCVLGPAALVNALDHGERAAASIQGYLLQGGARVTAERRVQKFLARNKLLIDEPLSHPPLSRPRARVPELEAAERVNGFDEIDGLIARETAYEEASRCMRCYRLYSLVTDTPLRAEQAEGITSANATATLAR